MKDRLLPAALGLLLLAFGAWLIGATEWADTETRTPARGEAATNPLHATQALLRALGGTVARRQSLDALPPPQASLVLVSDHWDLFPAQADGLRDWVEQGGHLVVPGHLVDHASLEDWLPVVRRAPLKSETLPTPGGWPPTRNKVDKKLDKDWDCHRATEPDSVPARYAGGRAYRLCVLQASRFAPADKQPVQWSLQDTRGTELLRVGFGRGSVTVIGGWPMLDNDHLLRGDNALLAAAALQAGAGREFWFVVEEARESFLPWLWRNAWIAVVLGLLALAAALWRDGVRFGPLIAPAGRQRRSMAEQVRGTAEFLQRHGGDALHAAQLRALDETAARQLRRQVHGSPSQRIAAIARATGLDANALTHAMAPGTHHPGALAADLELLETARRRLEALHGIPPPIAKD